MRGWATKRPSFTTPQTRVLVLQRNRSGTSASAFARYFQTTASLSQPITLEPILQSDAYSLLARMQEVRRLEVRFAGVTNPKAFQGASDQGVSEMIDVLAYFRAPYATVTLSMGHQPGSLFVQGIRNYTRV
jgi:hypothetical protein